MTRRDAIYPDRQRGTVSAFVALVAVALFVLLGLVVDGGRAISARLAADDAAEQAARAGAGQISVAELRAGQVVVDPLAASRAALAALQASGLRGTVTVNGDSVTVDADFAEPTVILGIVGLTRISGSVQATAVDVHGVTRQD